MQGEGVRFPPGLQRNINNMDKKTLLERINAEIKRQERIVKRTKSEKDQLGQYGVIAGLEIAKRIIYYTQ